MNKKYIIMFFLIIIISPIAINKVYSVDLFNIGVETPLSCYVTGQTVEVTIIVLYKQSGNPVYGEPILVETGPANGGFAVDIGTFSTNINGKIYVYIPVSSNYFNAGNTKYGIFASTNNGNDSYEYGYKYIDVNLDQGVAVNCNVGHSGGSPFVRKQVTETTV